MFNRKFYVYQHIRLDSNTPFYVGKGLKDRSLRKTNRNQYWKNIVNKHGYSIEILKEFEDEQLAFAYERYLIDFYKSLGWSEANICLGGEGSSGRTFKHSEATKKLIGQKSKGHPGFFKGKKLKSETKYKMTMAKLGKRRSNNDRYTVSQTRSKGFAYLKGGLSFASAREAAKHEGCCRATIRGWAINKKFGWSRICPSI